MRSEKNFLDFVYIGAPRAGSTWLAAALSSHPSIYIPNQKELHFFNDRAPHPFEYKFPYGIEHYRKYFKGSEEGQLLGDISPFYYLDPTCPSRMKNCFPDLKVIAFVRNPVDIVFSYYLKRKEWERRKPSLMEELLANPSILDLGYQYRNLIHWFDHFPSRIKVFVYESFFLDTRMNIKDIYKYLAVDQEYLPWGVDSVINERKVSGDTFTTEIKGQCLRLLNRPFMLPIKNILISLGVSDQNYEKMVSVSNTARIEISKEDRRYLHDLFKEDIQRLEGLLGVNLDIWQEANCL
jgi:hypothetical protein